MNHGKFYLLICLGIGWIVASGAALSAVKLPQSALDIVEQCDNKYSGEDQKTILTVVVSNKRGNKQTAVYRRFWKSNGDKTEKMTLFTLSPADAKNTAFMQYSYSGELEKDTEQWIYLPNLRKLKRVSVRDLSDRFLGSDLTFDDIRVRQIDEDDHKLLQTKSSNGFMHYFVESVPHESHSMYSRKIAHFELNKTSGVCLKRHIAYFDRNNSLIKKQSIQWQIIDNAWLWKRVIVQNAHTQGSSVFDVSKPVVNKGVADKWFTVRALKRGL